VHIAVVGAHLSGQPLNHQLTSRGATLVATARTAPVYRLHALRTNPPKPGLVRVGDVDGAASIEVEVWELDTTSFGAFVDEIPAPLGIGRVLMEDGTDVAGFLCEPIALEGATDITSFGGWRAYRATLPVRRARPHSRPGRSA
jgi:allophanate hydrolase